ncbi:transporter substrate-binding domain-containing protein [Nonomuraea antimicrobica]
MLVATTIYFVNNSQKASTGGHKPAAQNKLGLLRPGTLKVAIYDGTAVDQPGIYSAEDGSHGANPTGLDPGLALALGDRLGLKVEIVSVSTPSQMIDGVLNRDVEEAGRFDVALPSTGTFSVTQDEQKLDLIHYFDIGFAVYATWKTAQRIRSKADLCGMSISMGSYEDLVEKTTYEKCGPNPIKPAMKNGRLDAYVTSLPWAVDRARDSKGELHLSKGDLTEDVPLVMAVDSAKPALRDAIVKALNALIKSGEYGEMLADRGLQDGAVTAARIIRSTP